MNIKILGVGCPRCQSMYNTVIQVLSRENIQADVEYVKDIERILSYGVMTTPALVVNEKVVMLGYRGASQIGQVLREASKT